MKTFFFTYFSLFKRGYIGYSMKNSWFITLKEKNKTQIWPHKFTNQTFYTELPNGWVCVDGNDIVSQNDF